MINSFKRVLSCSLLLIVLGCRSAPPIRKAAIPECNAPTQSERSQGTASQLQSKNPVAAVNFNEYTNSTAVLSLSDLEGLAFRNHPALATAAANMQAAQGRQIQAGLLPNPTVGYHATQVGNQDTAGAQGGFVSQRFITGGKLRLDQAIAGKEIDEAYFRFHAQELRVLSDVRIRFYEALIAQRRVQLTEELVTIGDNLVHAAETLLKGRQATENDLLQAEIRAENARILHDNAVNESAEAWRRLTAVVGTSNLEYAPLVGDIEAAVPRWQWDQCYAVVLANHPELNAARVRADRAKTVITRAQREPMPNVDVFVSMRHQNITGSDVANIQLGMPLPIFNKNQGNIRSAQAEWVAACNEVQRVELNLKDRFAKTFREFENAQQQVNRYLRRILPKAEKSLDLVTTGYQKGQVEYLTLLTAQQTFVDVNLAYLSSVRELQVAAAKIDSQLLTGSLAKSE